MIKGLLLIALLGPPRPQGDSWTGADKVKHFLMSAFIQSASFSIARAAKIDRPHSMMIGGVSVATLGVWKEVHDRRAKRPFSFGDLAWDAAGALAAASLLNGTR
jgi:putative lipoprotein